MSDYRIQQWESQIGDLRSERDMLIASKEACLDSVAEANSRLAEIDGELEELDEKINHEPFDEEV